MAKPLTWTAVLAAVGALVIAAAAIGAGRGGGLGSQYDVSKDGKITLTLWWLGNQEVPGIEAWMKETVAKYQALHPNVTVKTVIEPVDTWTQTQKTACAGKSGPDLWYNWAGTWSLEQVWAGCTVPNESVLSAGDLGHVANISETRWQGKTWLYPLYRFVYPLVYNKALFKRAGLNPNQPPQTWSQFLAACQKLKAAGITPVALGLKDGFGGEILGSATFQKQLFSSYKPLVQMVIDGDYTSPKWKSWIQRVVELKPYVNNDVNSITFGDGLARFQTGKAAMVFGTPGAQQMIVSMRKESKQIGVMKPPVFGTGAYAGSLVNTGNGFQVTSWSKHQQAAGSFIAFTHTPERLKALYAETGIFPTDNRWSSSQAKSPTDKLMLGWLAQKNVNYPANYYPTDLDVNGNFVIFQGILGGNMTVDKAASTYENVIKKWRAISKAEIPSYETWVKSVG